MIRSGVGFANGAFVLDISVVLLVFIDEIIHDLCAAVWQLDRVLSFDSGSITCFVPGVDVGVAIFVFFSYSVAKFVVFGWTFMVRFWRMIRGRMHWSGGVVDKRSRGMVDERSRGVVDERSMGQEGGGM